MKKYKRPKIRSSVIDDDEYFFRDNEMARPTIYHDIIEQKEKVQQ